MTEFNFGNKQIGDHNTIYDFRDCDEGLKYWKILKESIDGLDENSTSTNRELYYQTKSCVESHNKKGLKKIYEKYGAKFIGTILCNVASEEIVKLLSWILLN